MKDLKEKGWVRLHRRIEDNPLWLMESFTKGQAWVDLFLNANHKENQISIRGNILTIKRGQIAWSELSMAKRWKWSKNKVRRFLSYLSSKTIQQIEQQKSSITTTITILKYDEYQENDTTDDTAERQQKDSRRYTNNNDKNDKNDKNIYNLATQDETNKIINLFRGVNPSYERLFANKTQREATSRLINKYGEDKITNLMGMLPDIVKKPFAPQITTPYELENKMGRLIIFMQQEKIKSSNKTNDNRYGLVSVPKN